MNNPSSASQQSLPHGAAVYREPQPVSAWIQWQLLEYQYAGAQAKALESASARSPIPADINQQNRSPSDEQHIDPMDQQSS